MPHCTLEYTANIPVQSGMTEFFAGLHHLLAEFDTISVEKIKSRAVCCSNFYMGSGENSNAFIRLEIAMFNGRSVEVRKAISQSALEYIKQHFKAAIQDLNCSVNVEVREIERATFSSRGS